MDTFFATFTAKQVEDVIVMSWFAAGEMPATVQEIDDRLEKFQPAFGYNESERMNVRELLIKRYIPEVENMPAGDSAGGRTAAVEPEKVYSTGDVFDAATAPQKISMKINIRGEERTVTLNLDNLRGNSDGTQTAWYSSDQEIALARIGRGTGTKLWPVTIKANTYQGKLHFRQDTQAHNKQARIVEWNKPELEKYHSNSNDVVRAKRFGRVGTSK